MELTRAWKLELKMLEVMDEGVIMLGSGNLQLNPLDVGISSCICSYDSSSFSLLCRSLSDGVALRILVYLVSRLQFVFGCRG